MHLRLNNGIEIDGLALHLDAHRKAEFSFVSHAHTDHIAAHKKILATPETILFFKERYKRPACRAVQLEQKIKLGDFTLELFPAGHILGCAQVRLTHQGRKITYTGDFKLQAGATTPPAKIIKSDILIMESTYGQKKYVFPKREKVIDQLINFVQKTLMFNQVPFILAYSLGKAQEAAKILGDFGFELYAEQSVYRFCKLYEKCGIEFKNLHPLPVEDFRGKVVIFPPFFKKYKSLVNKVYNKRVCFLSGWALEASRGFRVGADITLPLSDHADYNDLLTYIEKSGAKKIFTVHGFPEFAEDLRGRGYDAHYLEKGLSVSLEGERKIYPTAIENLDLFND